MKAGCCALLAFSTGSVLRADAGQADPHVTIVRKKRTRLHAEAEIQTLSDVEATSPNAIDALQNDPAITVLHQGQGLAPSRVVLQGLSGARIGFDLESLILDDGSFGYFDPSSLPLFKARAASVEAISPFGGPPTLVLSFADSAANGFSSSFGAGSFGAWLATMSADFKASDYQLQSAALAGGTAGDFSFQDPAGDLRQRSNNDHQRVSAVGKFQKEWERTIITALFFAGYHEGGIPGPMMAPTPGDQSQDSLVAAEVKAQARLSSTFLLDASIQVRHHQLKNYKRLQDQSMQVHFNKGRASGGLKFEHNGIVSTELALTLFSDLARGPEVDFFEMDGGAYFEGALAFSGKHPVRIFFESTLQGVSSGEFVPSARMTAQVFLMKELMVQAAIGHRVRRPSFLEKHFEFGLMRKNPKLVSETVDDLEIGVKVLPAPFWDLTANTLISRIGNAIFYDQVDYWHVAAVNMKPLLRIVLDAKSTWQIRPWLSSSVGMQYLHARFVDSLKTLPFVPPLSAVGNISLGYAEGIRCSLDVRYRSKATTNLFGGLENPAYAMASAQLRIPLSQRLAFLFSLGNFTDVTMARDFFEYPLPGLEVFGALEFFT